MTKLRDYCCVSFIALLLVQGCAIPGTSSSSGIKPFVIPAVNDDANADSQDHRQDKETIESHNKVLGSAQDNEREQLGLQRIADDFVHALRQIPTHPPAQTTIQLQRIEPKDAVGSAFKAAFESGGYGVRLVDIDASDNFFQYRIEDESITSLSGRHRFEIAIGSVEMRRTYGGLLNNTVRPLTPMYVRGADASQIVLNDSAFASGIAAAQTIDNDAFKQTPSSSDAEVLDSPLPTTDKPVAEQMLAATVDVPIERIPLSVPDEVNPLQNMVSAQIDAGSFSLPPVALSQVQNVFELGSSNYVDVLSDFTVVAQQILTFANDSLRLGEINKQLVENMVTQYEPALDIFSVIGCSMGPTAIQQGNAALALGRASRVREALLFAGVNKDKILDEGCWAGDSEGNALPRRGVVLTLNRKI